jgi:hypothetical protein
MTSWRTLLLSVVFSALVALLPVTWLPVVHPLLHEAEALTAALVAVVLVRVSSTMRARAAEQEAAALHARCTARMAALGTHGERT